jgi:hypothetical protein
LVEVPPRDSKTDSLFAELCPGYKRKKTNCFCGKKGKKVASFPLNIADLLSGRSEKND